MLTNDKPLLLPQPAHQLEYSPYMLPMKSWLDYLPMKYPELMQRVLSEGNKP